MDLNKFIEKAMSKYSKKGVTMVSISYWDGILDVRLMRPEGSDQTPNAKWVGIDIPEEGEIIPVQYAHCKFEMPIDEEKVFQCLDGWFNNTKKIEGYA